MVDVVEVVDAVENDVIEIVDAADNDVDNGLTVVVTGDAAKCIIKIHNKIHLTANR